MLSLSPQGLIYDAIIFAVVVYICSIQKILKDIIDREIYREFHQSQIYLHLSPIGK